MTTKTKKTEAPKVQGIRKAQLSFQERIKAAYLHHIEGVTQQAIAVAFSVNIGRVNEAVKAIETAAKDPKGLAA